MSTRLSRIPRLHSILSGAVALILKLTAQRLVGLVWGEIDDRQKIEPEQFERQRDKTLTKLQRRIETKIEQHAEARP